MPGLVSAIRSRPSGGISTGRGGTSDIISQFKAEQQKAEQARAKNFEELIAAIRDLGGTTGATFDQALQRLAGQGDAARTRAEQRGERTLAAGQQDLISSGLSSTTLSPNLRRGVADDVELQQQSIDEQVAAQQSGIDLARASNQTQIGLAEVQARANRDVTGPDLGLFASLLQQAAAAGDGSPVTAFVPPSSAAVNKPVTRIGSGGGSPGFSSFGERGGTPAPANPVRIVRNPNPRRDPLEGASDVAKATVLSDSAAKRKANPCPDGKRFFRGIGCF